jgi:hypothetical protein
MGEVASNSSFPLASDPDENEVSVEKDTLLAEGCRAVRVRSLCWGHSGVFSVGPNTHWRAPARGAADPVRCLDNLGRGSSARTSPGHQPWG